jgi:hypothetical protein
MNANFLLLIWAFLGAGTAAALTLALWRLLQPKSPPDIGSPPLAPRNENVTTRRSDNGSG